MANHDLPAVIATAYAVDHERAVRLAYAVAGAIEDYPMPVETVPNWNHVAKLLNVGEELVIVAEHIGVEEPPADLPEAT
jgi:hypothetical protein